MNSIADIAGLLLFFGIAKLMPGYFCSSASPS